MKQSVPMSLLIFFLLSCGSDDSTPPPPTATDACGNPTTETVNDKRCLYTVSTLTSSFDGSGGLTVGPDGDLYVANFGDVINDANGKEVHRVDPNTGAVSLFANEFLGASGNTFDQNGNLIQASIKGQFISSVTPDGTVTTLTEEGLQSPVGVVYNQEGNLYVCNCGGGSIQEVLPDGTSSRFVTDVSLNCPNGLTIDPDGNLYAANFNNGNVIKIQADGTTEVFATIPGAGNSHIVFGNNLIYVLSRSGNKLYEVTLSGEISVIAGTGASGNDDGLGNEASFFIPNGLGISNNGSELYVVSRLVGTGPPLNPVVVRVVTLP